MTAPDLRAKLELAEHHLDRVQSFPARIDSKGSALLATISAEIAVLVLNLTPGDFAIWWISIPTALFAATALFVGCHLYRCAFPDLRGGAQSLIYFKEIAGRREAQFIQDFTDAKPEDLLSDFLGQIWRNSEIVTQKYRAVQFATAGILVSLLFWVLALGAISLTHGRMPLSH